MIILIFWGERWDSNPRHSAPQADALNQLSYSRHMKLVYLNNIGKNRLFLNKITDFFNLTLINYKNYLPRDAAKLLAIKPKTAPAIPNPATKTSGFPVKLAPVKSPAVPDRTSAKNSA